MTYTATYSPDDNKLRLYTSSRLDAETYARVKAAGFRWAPKQELFVAPMWTPGREDLLIELAGEIEDEDKSLVDRAEERADRFGEYSERRTADAESAKRGVAAIADNIPLGQPILVGHHSEKRARKDAERINSGMRKAIKMWETASYWKGRAHGAVAAAKYKELPTVRARRIKTIEAAKRGCERLIKEAELFLSLWGGLDDPRKDGGPADDDIRMKRALWITNREHISKEFPLDKYPRQLPASQYEGSMSLWSALDGKVITPEDARVIATRSHGRTIERQKRWLPHYDNRLIYERAMLDEAGGTKLLDPKPRAKLHPLCNYRAPDGITCENRYDRGRLITYPQIEMTAAEWAKIPSDYKSARLVDNSHRVRTAMRNHALVSVFITDSKVHARPARIEPAPPEPRPAPTYTPRAPDPGEAEADAMRASLKAGVKAIGVPQLFETPQDLAERLIDYAGIDASHRVLEPSAGTGALLRAIGPGPDKIAIEINGSLVDGLTRAGISGVNIHCADFLQCNGDLGKFDRIVMNPPFENGADIRHIEHALSFLKPGGRLVAICANGPRQQARLKPKAVHWEELPAGSFKTEGTMVNVALCIFENEKLL
jgi:protein-L-isoaspartate O-methyltransferase